MRKVNLIDKKFGKLLVISELPIYISPNGHRKRMWLCECGYVNVIVVIFVILWVHI